MAPMAQAQMFKVTGTCSGGTAVVCEQLKSKLQDEMNKNAPEVSTDKYATGMAKANKISTKGSSTDYANMFDVAMIGANVNVGVQADLSDTKNLDKTASGLAIAPALLVGLNMNALPISKFGSIPSKDFDLFLSYMAYNNSKLSDKDGVKIGGKINHFGIEARYRWIKEKDIFPGYMLQWTGVQAHTGYQYTKNKLSADYNLKASDFSRVDVGGGVYADINSGKADATIEHSTHTIPLELSTGIRMLYVLTLYTGLATDLTMSSDSKVDINANASISANGVGGTTFGVVGKQTGKGKADFFNTRSFLGLQFNVPFVRVFAQYHRYLGDDTHAINAGLKILY